MESEPAVTTLTQLAGLIALGLNKEGLTVTATGHGYDNGDFEDLEVECSAGLVAYIQIRESEDPEHEEYFDAKREE